MLGLKREGRLRNFPVVLAGEGGEFGDSVEASGDVLATGSC